MTDPHSPIRTYVLDTSVLLSDPWACTRFAEHEVVVPLVVISELEAKIQESERDKHRLRADKDSLLTQIADVAHIN